MPFCKFLKPYPPYAAGDVVDLPGKLSYRLREQGVVVKVTAPPAKPVKVTVKRVTKKAK